jgi:hypothetical protein
MTPPLRYASAKACTTPSKYESQPLPNTGHMTSTSSAVTLHTTGFSPDCSSTRTRRGCSKAEPDSSPGSRSMRATHKTSTYATVVKAGKGVRVYSLRAAELVVDIFGHTEPFRCSPDPESALELASMPSRVPRRAERRHALAVALAHRHPSIQSLRLFRLGTKVGS